MSLQIFKTILQFIISSDLVIVFLLLFVLFRIIYKINFFSISSSLIFFIFQIWSQLFWLLFFVWDIFKNWLFYNSIFYRFFPIKFDPYSFHFYFFHFGNFLKLIVFVLSFNIKLVWNWAYWLSLDLGFFKLLVLEINPSLEGFSQLLWFFLSSCFSILKFSIYSIRDWAMLFLFILFL